MSAPRKPLDPECPLCCPEPCCPCSAMDHGNCFDCYNTGHVHAQCQPCPNCTDSPGDGVGHIPADDVACSECGFDIEAAALAAAGVDA